MPEHAIIGQLFQWSARKVSGVSHEQEVRQVVCLQLSDDKLDNRKGLVVGCERATLVHWAYLDSDPICIDFIEDCFHHLEEESRLVFQASRVLVFAEVGGRVKKLSNQVKIIGKNLYAVEAG